jgi:DNA polymerase III epsilon subunit-like protein
MSYFMVDVEADGPIPGKHSMVSFGAVKVIDGLEDTFYGQVRPISDDWIPGALAVSKHTREETLGFDHPVEVMAQFAGWLKEKSTNQPMFISDNNGFDWQFINYYFHMFYSGNPFGHSSTNLGSLYKGMQGNVKDNFQRFRKKVAKTKHTHHPVDDSKGSAEALLKMRDMGLKIRLD